MRQGAMDVILLTVKWQVAFVFLEGVFIFSTSLEEHMRYLQAVLGLPLRAGVSMKLRKCFFSEHRIDNFGIVIEPGILGISSNATGAFYGLQNAANLTVIK